MNASTQIIAVQKCVAEYYGLKLRDILGRCGSAVRWTESGLCMRRHPDAWEEKVA
jgi:hypothetical protein